LSRPLKQDVVQPAQGWTLTSRLSALPSITALASPGLTRPSLGLARDQDSHPEPTDSKAWGSPEPPQRPSLSLHHPVSLSPATEPWPCPRGSQAFPPHLCHSPWPVAMSRRSIADLRAQTRDVPCPGGGRADIEAMLVIFFLFEDRVSVLCSPGCP
jgi:hypothetical protein